MRAATARVEIGASGLVGLTLSATGCAGSDERARTSLPADCIIVRTIADYDALDGDDLVIYGPGNTAYHVVLRTPSLAIEDEFLIEVFDDGDGRLCPYGRDSVIIDGTLNVRDGAEVRVQPAAAAQAST